MSDVTNHQGNANYNHREILPTPMRMAILRITENNKCLRGCGEIGTLLHCWWEGKLVQPLWRTVWRFLKKQKRELPRDLAIPLLGVSCRPKISAGSCKLEKRIYVGLKGCSSGDTDSGKTERVFWGRGRVRAL